MPTHGIFVTGATGYLGRRVVPDLLARGHSVKALARSGSEGRLPAGVKPVIGDALDGTDRSLRHVPAARRRPASEAYWQARADAEAFLAQTGLNTTVLRPWYVLGPGHRWPYLLMPGYWVAERLPATRETARRLGLVTLDQMAAAIVRAVENPAVGMKIVEVPEIRRGRM